MENYRINLEDYHYHLPEEKIARFPLAERDQSKLLYYRQGNMQDHIFTELPELLPENSNLFFNNTKVIPARLYFHKASQTHAAGALIEIFLLHPVAPSTVISHAMLARKSCTWQCIIGNQKKWKPGMVLEKTVEVGGQQLVLRAELADREQKLVTFSWESEEMPFVDLVEATGQVPLPPYLNRQATEEDKPRYQTVYSAQEGAVAAPTAGLHFTGQVLHALQQKQIPLNYLTLHVSAGTFQPIKEKEVSRHPMHGEQLLVNQDNLRSLLLPGRQVIAVGTTSVRTLESVYWYGVQLLKTGNTRFAIQKLQPYEFAAHELPAGREAVQAVLHHMESNKLENIMGETEIFIFPGYQFRLCSGLITNFHMPSSTLILLIAAFVGDDWKKIYHHALKHDYRFLSYGDSSLLFKNPLLLG